MHRNEITQWYEKVCQLMVFPVYTITNGSFLQCKHTIQPHNGAGVVRK